MGPRLLRTSRFLVLMLLSVSSWAYEPVRRQQVDAGMHVPVLTKAPELLEFVEATYPADAKAAGTTADVRMKVTIDASGAVSDVEVVESVGMGFDSAAVDAVKRFRFSPAEIDGSPAPVQIEYIYHFVLTTIDAGVDAGPVEPVTPPAILKGRLIVRGTRTPLPGGTVRCENQPDGGEAYADDEGKFSFEVAAGLCKVNVSAGGFHTFRTEEVMEPRETREVKYFVLSKTIGYETIVRDKKDRKEVVNRTLERAELQKVPGTFGDPIRVIQNFPGVARAPFFSGQLVVRGANPNQTLFFLDGVQVPLLFHFGGGPAVINSEFIDKIDFFPGGFGARYGRAVGGVVDVQTRRGSSDAWHAVASADFMGAGLFVEAPVTDSISVSGSVRRGYIDAVLPLVLPKDPNGGTLQVLPSYWDYQVRIDVGTNRKKASQLGASTFSLMAFGSDDILKVVATGGGRDFDLSLDVHTLFHRLVGTYTLRLPGVNFKVVPWAGYDVATIGLGITSFKANRYTVGLRGDTEAPLTKWLTARVGLDLFFERLVGEAEFPFDQYVDFPGEDSKFEPAKIRRSVSTFDAALFMEADIKMGPVVITPGLRASYVQVFRQNLNAIDPRLWARWQIIEGWTAIKGTLGLFSQPPPAFSMDPELGNPNLKHEKAFQSSLGVSQKITESINVDLTGYFNRRYENIGGVASTANANATVSDPRSGNVAYGRSVGLELLLRHEVTKNFFGWVAYTLSRTIDGRNGGDLVLNANDQTHNLVVVGQYRFPLLCKREVACGGWELGGRFRLVTGNPKTPLQHRYDHYQNDANRFFSMTGAFRSARRPTFHQLDIRLDKNFVFDRWTFAIYLDIQNVYNAKNIEAALYDYRFREEYEVPGIPFLPVLGIRGSL